MPRGQFWPRIWILSLRERGSDVSNAEDIPVRQLSHVFPVHHAAIAALCRIQGEGCVP